MTPMWVQTFFLIDSVAMGVSLFVSMRRRRWITLLGRIHRDERPTLFWSGMAVGNVVFLMFLGLSVGSISQGVLR